MAENEFAGSPVWREIIVAPGPGPRTRLGVQDMGVLLADRTMYLYAELPGKLKLLEHVSAAGDSGLFDNPLSVKYAVWTAMIGFECELANDVLVGDIIHIDCSFTVEATCTAYKTDWFKFAMVAPGLPTLPNRTQRAGTTQAGANEIQTVSMDQIIKVGVDTAVNSVQLYGCLSSTSDADANIISPWHMNVMHLRPWSA
jgi:hypothetical protein